MNTLLFIACATCADAFKHGSGDGDAAGWAILFMLGIIVPMVAGVTFLMFKIARREKDNLDPKYHSAS